MASCFPAARYIFFFIAFVFAFSVANTKNKMEIFGLGLLFVVNAIFSYFITNDVLGFIQKPSTTKTAWTGLGAVSLISGSVLNLTSMVMMAFAFYKMNATFSKSKKEFNFSTFGREKIDEFKHLLISSIVLITVVSLNLYFTPETISNNVIQLLTKITDPAPDLLFFQIAIVIITLGLFSEVTDIINNRMKNDKQLDKVRKPFGVVTAMLVLLAALVGLRTGIRITSLEASIKMIQYGFDSIYDILLWAFAIIGIVFSGFTIDAFEHLGETQHKANAEYKKYLHAYNRHKLRPKFIFFMLFAMFSFLMVISNSMYFMEFLLLLIKVLAPLAIMGMTAYNVFLSNKLMKKAKNELIK